MDSLKTKTAFGTKKMVFAAMFVVLIAVGGFIKIPVPPVPISLQSFFVLLAGLFLGAVGGATAVTVYILLGLLGLPIFADGGGFAYVLKPSFGYILGFLPAVFITGALSQRAYKKNDKFLSLRLFSANLAGTAVIYVFGLIYLYFMMKFYLGKEVEILKFLYTGMIIFLPGDFAKCFLATLTAKHLIPFLQTKSAHGRQR